MQRGAPVHAQGAISRDQRAPVHHRELAARYAKMALVSRCIGRLHTAGGRVHFGFGCVPWNHVLRLPEHTRPSAISRPCSLANRPSLVPGICSNSPLRP